MRIAYLIFVLMLVGCGCPKEDKTYTKMHFKGTVNTSFIADLNGSDTFFSDSGRMLVFEEIKTTFDERQGDMCEPEECCDHIISFQEKRLLYNSRSSNYSIQFWLVSGDSSDFFSVSALPRIGVDPSDYTNLFYMRNVDIDQIHNQADTNCVLMGSVDIRGKNYKSIYRFKGYQFVPQPRRFAEYIYYYPETGIEALVMNDGSAWIR